MKKIFSLTLLTLTLTACIMNKQTIISNQTQAVKSTEQQEQFVDVKYNCIASKIAHPVIVRYWVSGNDILKAQVFIEPGKTTPILERDINAVNSDTSNIYTAQGISWLTDKADAQNIQTADGNMLQLSNGSIQLKYCKVNK